MSTPGDILDALGREARQRFGRGGGERPRTYRGRTVEELIPRIESELGSDAIILRRREGLAGGMLGFFQRQFVELEAMPGTPRVDVYDEAEEEENDDDLDGPFVPDPPSAEGLAARSVSAARRTPEFDAGVSPLPAPGAARYAAGRLEALSAGARPARPDLPSPVAQPAAVPPGSPRRESVHMQATETERTMPRTASEAAFASDRFTAEIPRAAPAPPLAPAEVPSAAPAPPLMPAPASPRTSAPPAYTPPVAPDYAQPANPAAPSVPASPTPDPALPQPRSPGEPSFTASPAAEQPRPYLTPHFASLARAAAPRPQAPAPTVPVAPSPPPYAAQSSPPQETQRAVSSEAPTPVEPIEPIEPVDFEELLPRQIARPAPARSAFAQRPGPEPARPSYERVREAHDPLEESPPAAQVPERRSVAPGSHARARAGVEKSLTRFGIGERLAVELLDAAIAHVLPLAPRAGLAQAVRLALAQRIPVAAPLPLAGGAIVVVGTGGAGKTTCCRTLLDAYRDGSPLAARYATLTREHRRGDLQLLLAPQIMKPAAASSVRALRAFRRARADGLAVVDTPGVSPSDRTGIRELGELLGEMKPERIVVALPVTLGATAATQLLEALTPLGANAIALTHADETDQIGVAVEVACAFGLAPEYLLDRRRTGTWRLARVDPAGLVARILP